MRGCTTTVASQEWCWSQEFAVIFPRRTPVRFEAKSLMRPDRSTRNSIFRKARAKNRMRSNWSFRCCGRTDFIWWHIGLSPTWSGPLPTRALHSIAQSNAGSWVVATPGTRQLSAKLNLSPPPVSAKQLDRLELRWGLTAVGDMATLNVADVSEKIVHRQDDVELTVESIEPREGNRFDITLILERELPQPDPQDIVFQEYQPELFDSSGKPMRLQGQANSLTDRGAQIRYTFFAESDGSQPKSLRLTYPRIRSQREVEIVFHNVPLPTARPD